MKTDFNQWYCIPSIPDCLKPILEPWPFHSLGLNDKLFVNKTYNPKKELAFAVKFKAVREKFPIKVERSSKSWYQVVCMQENYHWRTEMFEIKMFNNEHTCSSLLIHPNHRQTNSERICFVIGVGDPKESFSKLPVYFHNLKKHNLGTVTYIKTDSEHRFEYCFFAIGCAIGAFRECCRKVIIMDGAHLKGKYKCIILHVVVMDENNQILPIGYGICPKETTDSWTWFLEKLHECIGDVEGLTMVTYRAPAIAGIQGWPVFGVDNTTYQVHDFKSGGIVNLREKTCSCKYWQLTGSPCGHVIMVLTHLKNDHCGHMTIDAYKIETYRRTYEHVVYPLSELSDWEVPDDLMVVNPPVIEIRQAGRPKNTNRIPSQGEEPKIRRCSRCHSTTHNERMCKEIVPKNQSKSKKYIGALGSGTKTTKEEPTQATENQWQYEPENQWKQHTEQQWQQQQHNQWTQQTEHQWQQQPDNQWTQQNEH
uniref:SWIM-type domain-containing protein n=1 Tax=Lactuca sativa TaxID=4236 RepID=A0A9R1WU56_LACSA|nr:hypothetical protein LSAT_V11C800421730 [Lactuca sativa]